MTFRTIFEASFSQNLVFFPILGVGCVVLGVLMVLKPQTYLHWIFPGAEGTWGKVKSWIWIVFWSVWTAVTVTTFNQRQPASKNETIVEGRVTNYVRTPYNGPSYGSFVVAGKKFSFSEFDWKPLAAENSIRNGAYARVTFHEKFGGDIQILRIEVADGS